MRCQPLRAVDSGRHHRRPPRRWLGAAVAELAGVVLLSWVTYLITGPLSHHHPLPEGIYPTAPASNWPGAGNTGVPRGTVLTSHPGDWTITADGTTISRVNTWSR